MMQVMEAAQMAAIAEDIEKMPMGMIRLFPRVVAPSPVVNASVYHWLAPWRIVRRSCCWMRRPARSDVVTERMVELNLSRLPCTQVIIAHRLSTIRNAHVILVLDQGRIVEAGDARAIAAK